MYSVSGHQVFNVIRRLRAAQGDNEAHAQDQLAEETAVALVYNGLSHAVMMATPLDLEDFALGFSLTEGLIQQPKQLYSVEVRAQPLGIELHIEIASECFMALKQRRRQLTGRTGCGLCGRESLQHTMTVPKSVQATALPSVDAIEQALIQLQASQPLNQLTGAVHAAALCDATGHILLLREDVGRHNALDKLIGRYARQHEPPTPSLPFVLISSRASYEMVHKCASAGLANLVAVSAPTALAVQQAQAANMNLIGFARSGRHVIYTQSSNSFL